MKQRLERILNIRADEWPTLRFMWLLYFLILFGLYLGYFARESLFLKHIGADYLPAMYIVNSIAVMLVTTLYSSLTVKLDLSKLNSNLIVILIFSAGIIYTGILFGEKSFYVLLYIFVDVSWTVFLIMFWSLASHLYDAITAKRIFTIIASGWTAAMILSGWLTPIILQFIDIRHFLLVWIGLLTAIFFVLRMVYSKYLRVSPVRKKNDGEEPTFSDTCFEIKSSAYLRLLVAATVLHWLVLYLIDFYTAKTAATTYSDAKALAAFFGKIIGVAGTIALTVQLLIAGRLIKRFGVALVFVLFPVFVAFGAIPMTVDIVLGTIVIARITEYALGISIYDTAFQLLYSPISDEWRTKVRTFMDGSVKPVTVIVSGILIAVLAKFLPVTYFPFLFLTVVLLFVLVALRIRNEYGRILVSHLRQDGTKTDSGITADTPIESEHSLMLIREGLKSENEDTVVFTLDVLARSRHDEYLSQVARLIQDGRQGVRIAAMRALARIGNIQKLPGIKFILEDRTESLGEAVDTYAAFLQKDSAPEMKRFLEHPDVHVRLAACENIIRYQMAELLDRGLAELRKSLHGDPLKIKAIGIIGKYKVGVLLDELIDVFNRAVPNGVKISIVDAFQYFHEDRVMGILFSALENDTVSHRAVLSCKEIGNHQPSLVLSRPDRFSPIRMRFIPSILEDMEWKPIEAFFNTWLMDAGQAGYVVQALAHRKRKNLPFSVSEPVIDGFISGVLKTIAVLQYATAFLESADTEGHFTLISSQCKTNDRALKANLFAALSLRYDMNKMDLIFTCLQSHDVKYRALGLETIENILPRQQAAQIVPLFDNLPLMEIGDLVHEKYAMHFRLMDEVRAFLTALDDPWLNLAILHGGRESVLAGSLEHLPLPFGEGEDIMLQVMDKVFFLKSIPLFSELSVDELFRLAELAQEKKFAPHSIVFNEGEFGDSLYLIISGSVNICKTKEIPNEQKKQEIILATLKEKDCFGEMAILSGEPRSATVKANAPLTTLEIDKENFSDYMRSRPQVSEAIIKVLIQRLRAASARN